MRGKLSKPRAAALEQSGPGIDGGVGVDLEWDSAYDVMDASQLMAVFLETPSESMNQNLRAARVAAGGPERLPRNPDVEMSNAGGKGKGTKGEGKGGKCGKGYPPMAAWKTYNPDLSLIRPSQWGHWHPSNTQPQHLKSFVADGGWMAGPGVMLSDSLRRLSTRRETETKNAFSVLQEDSEPQTDSTLPEPMETSQGRSLGSPPSGGSAPGCSTSPGPSRRNVGRTPVPRPGERRPAAE